MKKGYLGTHIKMILLVAIIVIAITGVVYFMKNEYDVQLFEMVKTDMLLIEGKTKIVGEKVKIKEKDATYVGTKIEEMKEEESIKQLQEKGIIDLNNKENNYYVLKKNHLEELGLNTIKLNEDYYIVEYNSNEIIHSKGVKNENEEMIYKLSEFSK